VLLSLTLIGDAVTSLIMTTTADRFGRKRMLIIGASLMLFAGVLFAFTKSLPLLLIAAIIGVISCPPLERRTRPLPGRHELVAALRLAKTWQFDGYQVGMRRESRPGRLEGVETFGPGTQEQRVAVRRLALRANRMESPSMVRNWVWIVWFNVTVIMASLSVFRAIEQLTGLRGSLNEEEDVHKVPSERRADLSGMLEDVSVHGLTS